MKKIFTSYKLIFLIISILLFLYMIVPSLNPFDKRMFNFHDETQLGRVSQFVLNIKSGKIPPRLAPDFSFHLGFPVFNFYAPFSYWITGLINLIGIPVVSALKTSFFLAIFFSFLAMLFFLGFFFDFLPSLAGAVLYVASTYFATEVLIRGNLAESWYLVLLPLSLGLVIKNSNHPSKTIFFITTVVLSFLFTVHNIFSSPSMIIVLVFLLFLPRKKANLISFTLAILIGSYFLIPVIFESRLMNIASHIKEYSYKDHFLCLWQLWKSNGWNFGASLPGCDSDLMSFKLGKIQIIVGFLGFVILLLRLNKSKKHRMDKFFYVFIAILTVGSLYMTLYQSGFIWDVFSPVLSLLQFPWRFLLFGMFGLAFFASYFFQYLKIPFKTVLIGTVIIVSFVTARKYLIKPLYEPEVYNTQYNSDQYISEELAYFMPEYIVSRADYQYWRSFNIDFDYKQPIESKTGFKIISNRKFEKEVVIDEPSTIAVNIHYFPYWKIYINNKEIVPDSFDKLARPLITLNRPAEVKIIYSQTKIERIANILSLVGILLLFSRIAASFRSRIGKTFVCYTLSIKTKINYIYGKRKRISRRLGFSHSPRRGV